MKRMWEAAMQTAMMMMGVLICFQVKHFLADYVLQPAWMLSGKGDFGSIGGYAHAGLHAVMSVPALTLTGLGPRETAVLAVSEFVVHYLIDYGKSAISAFASAGPNGRAYWAMHGADQLLHQLTYSALTLTAVVLQDHAPG
jgi:hypothetical protein